MDCPLANKESEMCCASLSLPTPLESMKSSTEKQIQREGSCGILSFPPLKHNGNKNSPSASSSIQAHAFGTPRSRPAFNTGVYDRGGRRYGTEGDHQRGSFGCEQMVQEKQGIEKSLI
jgi:hypothetical protein